MKKGILKKKTLSQSINRVSAELLSDEPKKRYVFLEEYRNLISQSGEPLSEGGLERLCKELMEWSRQKGVERIEEFYLEKGIPKATFYTWTKKYEMFKEAHGYAMETIGIRSYKRALNKETSDSIFRHMQHVYDEGWKDANEYHHEKRKQLAEKSEPVHPTILVKTVSYDEIYPQVTQDKKEVEDECS